jgi:arabinan endo-1,5-alpha-L-arabinosidase
MHPNCIDPQAFFCKDNINFYMVYGSWSGGIFLLELDPETGMPKAGSAMNAENHGYGRKLIRNNHASIEGPYIIYSPETLYYYLFVSYGGLAANDGYNMRVFRSRNPYGPFEDAAHPGSDMALDLRHTEHHNFGVKIMGGYRFVDSNGRGTGFLSPGHNSVYRDSATGRYYLIYHQRFEGRGEYHEVRVHEMFLNEEGWFITAPFRHDNGTIRSFNRNSIPGSWRLINHGKENNRRPIESVTYRFLNNGRIRGPNGSEGTWVLGRDNKTAHITIDGILYMGIFLRSFDEDSRQWVQAFTALSGDGAALWGAGIPQGF